VRRLSSKPAIETSLDNRSSWRTPPKSENPALDFELCRRALRSNLKLRSPTSRFIRSVVVRFTALSKGISLVARIEIFAEQCYSAALSAAFADAVETRGRAIASEEESGRVPLLAVDTDAAQCCTRGVFSNTEDVPFS